MTELEFCMKTFTYVEAMTIYKMTPRQGKAKINTSMLHSEICGKTHLQAKTFISVFHHIPFAPPPHQQYDLHSEYDDFH